MVGKRWRRVWLLAALAVGAPGCSGRTEQGSGQQNAGGTSTPGSAGKAQQNAEAGSGASGAVGAGAATDGGAASAGAASAGAGGAAGGVGGEFPSAGAAAGGAGGAADPNELLKVKPSPGCGKDPTVELGMQVKQTIQTSGVKEPDCADKLGGVPKCGPWSLLREYYVTLPADYQKTQPYPLVLQAPGCGGNGTNVYSLSPTNTDVGAGVNGSVIRVGLTPAPNSIGHGTNENQGCFDDKEGDDSVDFVFYENLLDKLKTELCYDESRVFAVGNSSGAWLSNELGCKYAGDTKGHAIRGILPNTGGLPNDPKFSPTCSGKPLAGFWIYENSDSGGGGFNGNIYAISRAMTAASCMVPNYSGAVAGGYVENFPIGNGMPATTCQRMLNCAAPYPLVVCALPGNVHGGHDDVVNPGFAAFLNLLAPP
jgi:predicted esterase